MPVSPLAYRKLMALIEAKGVKLADEIPQVAAKATKKTIEYKGITLDVTHWPAEEAKRLEWKLRGIAKRQGEAEIELPSVSPREGE